MLVCTSRSPRTHRWGCPELQSDRGSCAPKKPYHAAQGEALEPARSRTLHALSLQFSTSYVTREYKRPLPHQTQTQILKTKQQTHEKASTPYRLPYRVPPDARCRWARAEGPAVRGWRAWSLEFFFTHIYFIYTHIYRIIWLRHISNSFTWTPPKETRQFRAPCCVALAHAPRVPLFVRFPVASRLAVPPKHWRTPAAATSRSASQEAPDHPLGTLLAVGHVGEHVPSEGCELRDDAE
jgi:hypothetical protein